MSKSECKIYNYFSCRDAASNKSHQFLVTEVVEHCCSIPSLLQGETLSGIAKDLDTYSYKLPLGVCAGIAPFNFPAMVPLWMFPVAMTVGNTYVMKVQHV